MRCALATLSKSALNMQTANSRPHMSFVNYRGSGRQIVVLACSNFVQ